MENFSKPFLYHLKQIENRRNKLDKAQKAIADGIGNVTLHPCVSFSYTKRRFNGLDTSKTRLKKR
ncbi:MAG: hypothetical protein IKA99_00585 [Clostridia bacterium]|nr:hypothetical protein [Clostridia bacterium]